MITLGPWLQEQVNLIQFLHFYWAAEDFGCLGSQTHNENKNPAQTQSVNWTVHLQVVERVCSNDLATVSSINYLELHLQQTFYCP